MIVLAALCGVFIIALGFATGSPEHPPFQALTFGGMFVISALFGRLWRLHGIGAATLVALVTTVSFGDAIWVAIKTYASGGDMVKSLIGQLIASAVALSYSIVGLFCLLKIMRSSGDKVGDKEAV